MSTGQTVLTRQSVDWKAYDVVMISAMYPSADLGQIHRPRPSEKVLQYLARYTHRVTISNDRLIAIGDDHVVFRYKDRALRGP